MKSNNSYDEKQLIDRGKAFQYGFIAAIFTIGVMYFITEGIELEISSYASFLITLWLPLTVCFITLIIKNAYDGVNTTSGRSVLTLFGIAGLFLVSISVLHIATGAETLLYEGKVSDTFGHLFNGICMIIICLIYWIKQYHNSKKFKDE